jgi:hypothetical protein
MPLKLVLGPANAAKAGEVLGAYGGAARRGGLLIVPTAADAAHYARELAGDGALLGTVLTFPGLAREIARRVGLAAAPLSPLQRERVLARVLARTELPSLAGAAGTPGLRDAAGALIAELQRALVTPQRFAQALAAWAAEDPRRQARAADLAALYRGYARELVRAGRPDGERFTWWALDALRAAPARWGPAPVYFYGFDDLLAIERDAVETLARVAGVEVVVSLTYEPGRVALAARASAVEELRAFADEVLELPALDRYYAPASRAALHGLERGLFEPAAERVAAGGAVTLLEAGGERAEAELAGAEVLALLREGILPEQVAIVVRSLERAAPLLDSVLGGYGIAVAYELEVPLSHAALGRSLLALARCAGPDGAASADELLRWLRTPGRLERPELADGLELRVRRGALRSAAQAQAALGWRLEELDALRAAEDPGAELVQRGRELLAAGHPAGTPLDAEGELDARALGRLAGALEELSAVGERPGIAELPGLLETLRVQAGRPARPGAVLLTEPLEVRARRFRAVIACGLCEGEWPAPGRGDPLLGDEQRTELARCSGLRLAPREDRLEAERYLFYSAVSRATERLALSWRSCDEEGNLVLASPFLADVCQCFEAELWQRRRRRPLAEVVWPADQAPTERERARARAAEVGLAAPAGGEADALALSAPALACVRHSEVVSGGALELFAACPVAWLVDRQLEPVALEPDSEPLRRGSYMHWVLERVLSGLGGPLHEGSLALSLELLDRILAEPWPGEDAAAPGEPPIGLGRPERVRAAMRLGIAADLRRYLRHEAARGPGWPPASVELRFGFSEEGGLPALTLSGEPGPVALRGVIDRIDVEPGSRRAIVRDYKSGAARPEHQGARWLADASLQVGLYMLAVARLLELEPVAGLYQPLGGRDLRPRGVFRKDALDGDLVANDGREPAELEALLSSVEGLAVELAARLRAGRLARQPQTCSRDGCRFPGICRGG